MTSPIRQFMTISIVGMTILILSLLYFHVDLGRDYLEVHLGTHNKNLAIVLRNSLLAEGLEDVLVEGRDELPESILQSITVTLERELRWVHVVKVKVYSKNAVVIFSTMQEEIGESAESNKGVLSSLNGEAVSSMVDRDDMNEFDNRIETKSIHQQYIPIENHLNGDIIGVFEIYTDTASIIADLNIKQRNVFWTIGAILAAFYIALAWSFLSTHRLLKTETRQRRKYLDQLQGIHKELGKRVEERTAELQQSEARLQSIMDNVPEAIITCDSYYVIQSINNSAQSLFKDNEPNLIGSDFNNIVSGSSKPVQLTLEDDGHKMLILKRKDGTVFPADIWVGPIELSKGVTSYIVVIHDMTAQLKAQEEIETTRQQYFHQEKMAAIGQLAAGILHEVGNPIAAIAGAAADMKLAIAGGSKSDNGSSFDDVVDQNVKLIDEQTSRLAKITHEIADFASPNLRQRELIDINALLRSTAQILTYDQRFHAKEMDIQLDRNLPAIVAVADQLTQVFMNLLINSIDASNTVENSEGRILVKSQMDGDRVHILVQDFGEGMSQEILGHALEPFFTTKPVGKGTGLGLSLCNTIVQAHGGDLRIDSEEGKGTTVHVYLPIDIAEQNLSSDELVS